MRDLLAINEVARKQIESIALDCKEIQPLVVIRCTAFNQRNYIEETLEGFIKQVVTFPFIVIVHDDASTDDTSAIIRSYSQKYPDIIKPIIEDENQYSKRNGSLDRIMREAISASGAKYVAMCEGDDYWIDTHKLQKQVDFLEKHPDYGMSFTKSRIFYQTRDLFKSLNIIHTVTFEELLYKGNSIPTASVVLRTDLLMKYYDSGIREKIGKVKMGDYQIWLWMANNYNIHFLDQETTVYRVLDESASHGSFSSWLEFLLSAMKIREYFADLNKMNLLPLQQEKLNLELAYALEIHDEPEINRLLNIYKQLYDQEKHRGRKFIIKCIIRYPRIIHKYLSYRHSQTSNPSKIYMLAQKLNKIIGRRK